MFLRCLATGSIAAVLALGHLEELGSEPLQAAIAAERAAIGKPLNSFVGMTIEQARMDLLGAPSFSLYVPNLHQADQGRTWVLRPTQIPLCGVSCSYSGCATVAR